MPTLSRDTLYCSVQYKVINPETKTLHRIGVFLLCDDNAKQYSNPAREKPSPRRTLVRYHIGDTVKVEPDNRLSYSDAHVFDPCEDMLKANGYTVGRSKRIATRRSPTFR